MYGVLRSSPRIHRRFIAACYRGDLGQHGGTSESRPYGKRSRVMKGQGSDQEPKVTGTETEDYLLRFRVPDGLMPDKQFDGRPARLQVHRVRPVYENDKIPSEPPQPWCSSTAALSPAQCSSTCETPPRAV